MEDRKEKVSSIRFKLGKWIAMVFSVFVFYAMITLEIPELKLLALFLSFTLALTFIHYPLIIRRSNSLLIFIIDLVFSLLSFIVGVCILIDYWNFIERVGLPTKWDVLFGFISILLILEATRRTVGLPLVIIVIIFLLYTLLGHLLPSPLSHKGYDLERITTSLYMTQNGVFGIAIKTMAYFIFLFIAFGAFFGNCGGTEFFINLASSIFGRLRGGPAKIAVVSSGFMGTISGYFHL